MTKYALFGTLVLASVAQAQTFKVAKYSIGGDGGTDYLTAEPGTGRVITVTVNGDSARWKPRTAVVFAGGVSGAGPPAADRCCGYINFFTTMRAARAWARRHPEIRGDILRRRGALRIGIDQFGSLLQTGHGDASEPRP